MGRVITNNQCVPSNCGSGNYAVSAAYDLAGNMTSLTYPDGQVMNYAYDSAGRALSATDASNSSYASGASPYGALDMAGNAWEWVADYYNGDRTKRIIRGGAFDTYFETQVHTQFQSGENPLARKHNVGFRCALGFCDVVHMTNSHPAHAHDQSAQLEEVSA